MGIADELCDIASVPIRVYLIKVVLLVNGPIDYIALDSLSISICLAGQMLTSC